jgi:hypothetical protein
MISRTGGRATLSSPVFWDRCSTSWSLIRRFNCHGTGGFAPTIGILGTFCRRQNPVQRVGPHLMTFDFRLFRLCRFNAPCRILKSCRDFSLQLWLADLRWERLSQRRGIGRIERLKRGTACGCQSKVDPDSREEQGRPELDDQLGRDGGLEMAVLRLARFLRRGDCRTSSGSESDC